MQNEKTGRAEIRRERNEAAKGVIITYDDGTEKWKPDEKCSYREPQKIFENVPWAERPGNRGSKKLLAVPSDLHEYSTDEPEDEPLEPGADEIVNGESNDRAVSLSVFNLQSFSDIMGFLLRGGKPETAQDRIAAVCLTLAPAVFYNTNPTQSDVIR